MQETEMMMIGEGFYRNPTVDVPPWSPFDDQFQISASGDFFLSDAAISALRRYLPANEPEPEADADDTADLSDPPIDAYSCDEFRIYEFKVRRCARGRSHDWTECPYAHPGEKARRRDPRKFHYSGVACPDFRKGSCKRGDSCEFAHGVFECWLHPARYRTQPCKDGTACRRRVCFFAHTPEQLRYLPHQKQQRIDSYDGSPMRLDGYFSKGVVSSSPTSTLMSPPMSPPAESPPVSPMGSRVNELLASIQKLQISKVNSMPSSWGGLVAPGIGLGSGFRSLPSTPTKAPAGTVGRGWMDLDGCLETEEPVERVESGRALRAKIYERLSKESGLERPKISPNPDVGWVSELIM